MTDTLIKALGWFGQACFFSRFLLQWGRSEKAGRIVVPVGFWWLSLVGSLGLVVFASWEKHPIFAIGAALNLIFYARNLSIHYGARALGNIGVLAFAFAVSLGAIAFYGGDELRNLNGAWLAIGILGQAIWIARFPYQWYVAEREAQASLTFGFFLLSALGSVLLLIYAIKLGEAIWIAGQAFGPFLYGRNLILAARGGSVEGGRPAEPVELTEPAQPAEPAWAETT